MKKIEEVAVYLFLGFLESGKTTFIQSTMEDPRFNAGEKTLLLICEEGEQEYEPELFAGKNVVYRTLEDKDELTFDNLTRISDETGCEKVVVEYNGMWLLNEFFDAMPENWAVYQVMMSADATTFENYNSNMRSLVVDKLNTTQMIAFNRVDGVDKDMLHKIVRGLSRSCSIYYEYRDGNTEYDDVEDPLPFDKDSQSFKVEDRDYALFYRDLMEEMKDYNGKTVTFTGFCITERMPKGTFAVGRHVMNCCAADIQFYSLLAVSDDMRGVSNSKWVTITARIDIKFSRVYGRKGPVLKVLAIAPGKVPEEPVATFY